jgi:hypothetical protein
VDALRAEIRTLQRHNEELARKVDILSNRVELLSTRPSRPAGAEASPPRPATQEPLVPPDLAVVQLAPPAPPRASSRPAPPIATAVSIEEPDAERLDALARPRGGELAAEAEAELRRARKRSGVERAHALEEFVSRYPRHASADNALVEAAAAYAEAGAARAACELAHRATEDYPAGDAMSDALERLAWCESRLGARDAERRLLERLVAEFPRTPAAERAGTRLATISGRNGEVSPDGSARSGP